MRQIHLHKQAAKFIAKLPHKQRQQVAISIATLKQNAQPQDSKKLQGCDKYYRFDCGEYRIIYDWDETDVNVHIVGKRNDGDVYRKLQRSF